MSGEMICCFWLGDVKTQIFTLHFARAAPNFETQDHAAFASTFCFARHALINTY